MKIIDSKPNCNQNIPKFILCNREKKTSNVNKAIQQKENA